MIENYKGYVINVEHDDDAMNPDEASENIVFLTASHRQFTVNVSKETLLTKENIYWELPLYAYIHSGVSLSLDNSYYPFNDRFDACQVGTVFVESGELKAPTLEKAQEVAKEYIEAWNNYLSGEMWRFSVIDELGEIIEGWGDIYDNEENVLKEAREVVDSLV